MTQNPMTNGELNLVAMDLEKLTALNDISDNPFKLMVDPVMRLRLRQAIFKMIESHDAHLAEYVAEGKLNLDSYKEYIELFARSLKESMETREGVHYLISACGFESQVDSLNLQPQWRWNN
jgi:hypothetical protein